VRFLSLWLPNVPGSTTQTCSGVKLQRNQSVARLPRLLVVDDEARCRRVLQMRLETRWLSCSGAARCEEALTLFHREQPMLVVSRLMLPKA